ncbi:hypothetical protein CA13_31400 [Planctomycetes bacterium CA13]|uniref:Uncharacterized protein n=1 Tax=Novipirellula herctigrandis TaxID=2527986 RepID=A0A5C5Z3Y4_9BACT|nr:hypothetical protein CA13_31400 [Planctomycetes bacterium CA13]
MTPDHGPFTLIRDDQSTLVGSWAVIDDSDDVTVSIDGNDYRIECARDLPRAVYWFVRNLENKILKQHLTLKACTNCEHFQMSGMAIDMGRGHVGVCKLHQIGARTLHACDDFNVKPAASGG